MRICVVEKPTPFDSFLVVFFEFYCKKTPAALPFLEHSSEEKERRRSSPTPFYSESSSLLLSLAATTARIAALLKGPSIRLPWRAVHELNLLLC